MSDNESVLQTDAAQRCICGCEVIDVETSHSATRHTPFSLSIFRILQFSMPPQKNPRVHVFYFLYECINPVDVQIYSS